MWCFGELQRAPVLYVSVWKEFRERWSDRSVTYQIRTLWGLQVAEQEGAAPENLVGYSFISKGQAERGERPRSSSFLSRCQAYIINSSSRLGRGCFLSPHGQARTVKRIWSLWTMSIFPSWGSHWAVLSPLGRMWVSSHRCSTALRASGASVAHFCC